MPIRKDRSKVKETDIKIRYATKGDAVALQKIFNKVVKEQRFLPILRVIEIEEIDNEWFDLRNQNFVIVAEVEGEIVGLIQLGRFEDDASMHVCEMGIIVDPNHRSKGVGNALLKKAIDTAKHYRFEKICLSVFHTNSIAIALYKKFGFQEVGRRKKQFKIEDEYIDEILMEHIL